MPGKRPFLYQKNFLYFVCWSYFKIVQQCIKGIVADIDNPVLGALTILDEQHSAPLRDVYLKVSDDTGQFFGKKELEAEMIKFTKEAKELARNGSQEAIRLILPQLIAISKSYNRQINLATSISNGVLVNHQDQAWKYFLVSKAPSQENQS